MGNKILEKIKSNSNLSVHKNGQLPLTGRAKDILLRDNIIQKINSKEIQMKPRWEFVVKKWAEVGLWLGSIGVVVVAAASIAYFFTIYSMEELGEFGDLGIEIVVRDFPYIWGITAILCLLLGTIVLINTGENYKRSWQRNLMITAGMALVGIIVILYLRF